MYFFVFYTGIFYTDIFYTGIMYFFVFYTGIFYTDIFYTGIFYTDIFYTGIFYTGIFYTGIFYIGVFVLLDGLFSLCFCFVVLKLFSTWTLDLFVDNIRRLPNISQVQYIKHQNKQ